MHVIVVVSETTEDAHSGSLVHFSTPHEASVEFGILLDEIVEELEKNNVINLRRLKTVSATLTIQKASKDLAFTDEQLEVIQACNSIYTLLVNKLRRFYRWYDFSMLTTLMSSIKSEKCLSLLKQFEVKVKNKMTFQQICMHCQQESVEFPAEYHKIVAIVNDKLFPKITQKECDMLKHFVCEHCGVGYHVTSPVTRIAPASSLILEWYIPVTAVAHMIKIASSNKVNFIKNCFLYLKISSTLILECRDTVSAC